MIEEIWKDIEGFEGLYQVSTHGNVRSKHSGEWKLLKPVINQYGYRQFGLHKNGKQKPDRGHRLVAKAFLPNPDNLPQINHIDEDKTNDCVDNLEWCTPKHNVNHGTRNERASRNNPTKERVCMFDEEGNILRTFESIMQATKQINGHHEGIIESCKGEIFSYKGYLWRYEDEKDTIQDLVRRYKKCPNRKKKVILSNSKETIICRSISAAARIVGICNASIHKYSSHGEYKWEIID